MVGAVAGSSTDLSDSPDVLLSVGLLQDINVRPNSVINKYVRFFIIIKFQN
jgi:hypothetical protein